MKKLLIKLALSSFLIFIAVFYVFKYSWLIFDDNKLLENFATKINQTELIPDSLMEIYFNKYHHRNGVSITREIFIGPFTALYEGLPERDNCLCDDILKDFIDKKDLKNKLWIRKKSERIRLGFGLESIVGTEKCLNYFLVNEYNNFKIAAFEYPTILTDSNAANIQFLKYKSISKLNKIEYANYLKKVKFLYREVAHQVYLNRP
jgi:hypothetical protein